MAGKPVRCQPAIISRSVAQMPQAAVRMRTWPGPGSGSGPVLPLQPARRDVHDGFHGLIITLLRSRLAITSMAL